MGQLETTKVVPETAERLAELAGQLDSEIFAAQAELSTAEKAAVDCAADAAAYQAARTRALALKEKLASAQDRRADLKRAYEAARHRETAEVLAEFDRELEAIDQSGDRARLEYERARIEFRRTAEIAALDRAAAIRENARLSLRACVGALPGELTRDEALSLLRLYRERRALELECEAAAPSGERDFLNSCRSYLFQARRGDSLDANAEQYGRYLSEAEGRLDELRRAAMKFDKKLKEVAQRITDLEAQL